MDKPVTLRQLSIIIGTKYTTLLNRIRPCSDYIPYSMDGKFKVYSANGIEIIKHINQLYQDGNNINQILPILELQYDRQIDVQTDNHVQTVSEQSPMSEAEKNRLLFEQAISVFVHKQEEMQYEIEQLKEFKKRVELNEQRANKSFWQWLKDNFGG